MEVDLDNFEQSVALKLRKNRRIDSRWGAQYFVAVNDTVFGLQRLPYMPMEPPASLSEEIVESDPLHVCKQCKDCFRFQNSYEDHNKRRSWILGLWCYNCFITNCTHMSQVGSKCLLCKKQDVDKRSYLRTRGLARKNQKFGAIKVFYNQCQFFEHMKMHGLSIVDMGDIMLMPLPAKMNNDDWSLELEIICEALMEHTFLLRIHIMDWLKLHNVEDKWWKLVNGKSNNSLIEKIVAGYQGRQLFKTLDKSTTNQSVDFFDGSKNEDANSYSANTNSDKNMSENEDNPCMSTDIAFVDCGPTSQYFEPELSESYVPRKHNKCERMMIEKSIQNAKKPLINRRNNKRKIASLKNLDSFKTNVTSENTTNKKQSLKSYKIQTHKIVENNTEKHIVKTGLGKTNNNSAKVKIPLSANRIILPKINVDPLEQNLPASITNSNSKILIIQTPKNADITSIINQLPSYLISNKKLVIMKQDSNNVIIYNKNEVSAAKETNKSILDSNADSISSQTKICDSVDIRKQQVADKIIIKNGKKYLIKYSKNGTENSENSSNLSTESNTSKIVKDATSEHSTSTSTDNSDTIINIEQVTSLQNDISFINFTPSSSELPGSSKCDLPVKKSPNASNLRKVPPHLISISSEKPNEEFLFETISVVEKNNNLFMQIKIVDRLTQNNYRDNYGIVLKYRDDMINEFHQLDSFELKKRIEHLQHVSEEIPKVLNFVSYVCLKEKLRAVNTIKHVLERCLDKCNENIRNKDDDWLLNDWESKVTKTLLCSQCNRFMKPKSYIPGFSKLIEDDDKYCLCYKEVCGECLSYQETQAQLIAHQNLHKKRKPYICPDCHVSFTSSKSLEIHLWTVCFHKLKKRMFYCRICQIDGFRDMESITRHFVIMHSYVHVACGDCLQIFRSSNEYVQHCTEVHPLLKSKQNPIRLIICKLGDFVVRYENYMSYLKMHPGIKKILWFKCPFCPLVTLRHKHLTEVLITHLRSKHLSPLSQMYSMEVLNDMFGREILTSKVNPVVTDTEPSFASKVSRTDNTVIPKIVNTRTISSEIFERANVTPPIMEKVDDEEKVESYRLPTISDIRSIAENLEPSISEQSEVKENSQIKVIKIEAEKEDPLAYEEETIVKLNDSKSNYKEETVKTEESKSNSKSISSCVSEFERPLLTDTDGARINSSTESNKKVSDSESTFGTSTDGRIKVIDIRKICKPDVEPLLAVEPCEAQPRNENANYMTFIPKPPPLTKMPQYLLEFTKVNEPDDQSKKSRKSHGTDELKKDTQEKIVDYQCHLCNEQINTSWPAVRTHFREKHSQEYTLTAMVTPQLLRMSPDFISGGYKEFISSKKRKSDSALYMSKRKRRWTSKKHTEMKETNVPIGLCVEQETAEDGEGNFKCKKCDQRCTDMANLREHIAANHRLKGRYLICLECGENFVVAPSLQMHLKAFHGIEDPINYMSQNPSYAPDVDNDSEAEGKTTVANQCHVCMAVFEDKAAVDKHLRVHGMAFLNRKRIEARNAMKTPEKKINSEEDKQSIIKDSPKKIIKPAETILEKLNAAI